MNSFLVQKYGDKLRLQSVEVQVGDTSGKYFLPDDSTLRQKKIVGFFTNDNDDDDKLSPTGRAIVSPAAIKNGFLTIYHGNDKKIDALPLEQIAVSLAERDVYPFELQCLSPSKSFIQVASPSGKVAAGESFLLYFIYLD